jgi:EAL domain-containing protein (putative c-di-GMP-specific phosphodiesterase class I)
MTGELRRALEAGEFVLYYQPKMSLVTHRFIEAEALLRWEHPERGLLSPTDFLDSAVRAGLAVPIGLWVLHTALPQIARWTADGLDLGVCINLSAPELNDPALLVHLDEVTTRVGLSPLKVNLEMTESAAITDLDGTVDRVLAIRRRGMHVTLDDFGTGYSSLTWLQQLPVDMLKIDRSFTMRLGDHPQSYAIVDAVIRLSHALGLVTIAEGVETAQHLRHLEQLGCDHAQGYYLSPPVPAAQLPALLVTEG